MRVLLILSIACTGEKIQGPVEETELVDEDGDGYPAGEDCDDSRDGVSPDAEELCNGFDDDCDTEIDEGLAEEWFPDEDGDGFGADDASTWACTRPDAHVPNSSDCNDGSALTFPGADEYCDGIDNDCDGSPDPTACRPLETADIRLIGQGAGHRVGHVVTGLGDLDGDGFADFAVGGPGADASGSGSGSAWFFDGPLPTSTSLDSAGARFDGASLDEAAGWALAPAGDVDADGFGDVLIGAWGEGSAGSGAGAIYLLRGPLSGSLRPDHARARLRGENVGDAAGRAVAGAGDVDGDGIPDLLIGAPDAAIGAWSSGVAYLVSGDASGVAGLGSARARLLGGAEGEQAGAALCSAGDLNGDGLDDIAVAAPGSDLGGAAAGAVFVLLGPVTGEVLLEAQADAALWGGNPGDHAGTALAPFGDFDGDGYSAFLVGAPDQSEGGEGAGAAYLVNGMPGSGSSLHDAHARIVGRLPFDHAGNAIGSAGDVNGDGELDVIVGAYIEDSGGLNAGSAFLVHGPVTGTRYLSGADAGFIGEAESDLAGWSAAGAGDVDGDGLDDLLVGAPQHDAGGDNAGIGYLLYAAGL